MPAAGATLKVHTPMSPGMRGFRAFIKNRLAVVGAVIIGLAALFAIAGPLATPYDPNAPDLSGRLFGPTMTHLLGTDQLGRDVLARILYGARYSLLVGVIAVSIGASVGTIVGLVSGYYGGITDLILGRIVDTLMAFPGILLAVAIAAAFGAGLTNVMIATGIWSIPTYARIVRSTVLALAEMDFVLAARAVGVRDRRIIGRHIFPNAIPPLLVLVSLGMATAILAAAGLSFLGLGAQPPTAEWGAMLNEGRAYMRVGPGLAIYPGVAIMLVVIGFNLVGDGLRDALDPKRR